MNLLFWKKKPAEKPVVKTREDYEKEGLAMPVSDAVKAIAASIVAGEWELASTSCGLLLTHPSGLKIYRYYQGPREDSPLYKWTLSPNPEFNWAENVLLENALLERQTMEAMAESKKKDAAIRTLIEKYKG